LLKNNVIKQHQKFWIQTRLEVHFFVKKVSLFSKT